MGQKKRKERNSVAHTPELPSFLSPALRAGRKAGGASIAFPPTAAPTPTLPVSQAALAASSRPGRPELVLRPGRPELVLRPGRRPRAFEEDVDEGVNVLDVHHCLALC